MSARWRNLIPTWITAMVVDQLLSGMHMHMMHIQVLHFWALCQPQNSNGRRNLELEMCSHHYGFCKLDKIRLGTADWRRLNPQKLHLQMVWQPIFMTRQPCHVWIWLCPNGMQQNIQNPIDHPFIAIVPIKMTMLDHFGILLLRQTSKHLSIGQVRRARARANEKTTVESPLARLPACEKNGTWGKW